MTEDSRVMRVVMLIRGCMIRVLPAYYSCRSFVLVRGTSGTGTVDLASTTAVCTGSRAILLPYVLVGIYMYVLLGNTLYYTVVNSSRILHVHIYWTLAVLIHP